MRILHVFSANIFTGSVAYALELAAWQQSMGHEILLASDRLAAPKGLRHWEIPIHNRGYGQRFRNAQMIRKLIRKHDIQVIHAHSRAASWVSNVALRGLRVALVSTVHGRQHNHFSSRHIDVYGQRIIAVSESLRDHLVHELRKEARKVVVIPNGVNPIAQAPDLTRDAFTIHLIGRLTGPKGARAAWLMESVFPRLLAEFPDLHISVVGGADGPIPDGGDGHAARLAAAYPERFRMTGFVTPIDPYVLDAGLVIGAGRVAILGLMAGRTVFAIGEAASRGIVTPGNVEQLRLENFGDMGAPDEGSFSSEQVYSELSRWCANRTFRETCAEQRRALAQWACNQYSWSEIGPRIMRVYGAAIMERLHNRHIPVLMYHKVPEQAIDTPHRIFVTKDRFHRHLQQIRWLGKTPITFSDYLAFARGDRAARLWPRRPLVLTFDDGYADNHEHMLPLMRRYGYRGVLFLLGDFSQTHNFWDGPEGIAHGALMTLNQAKDFVSEGWEIGAHTISHPKLSALNAADVIHEIKSSKYLLESQLGLKVETFAYPYGDLSAEVKQITAQLGFEMAVATDTGGLRWEDDLYQIFRVNIFPEDGLFAFWKKTSSWYRAYYFRKRGH